MVRRHISQTSYLNIGRRYSGCRIRINSSDTLPPKIAGDKSAYRKQSGVAAENMKFQYQSGEPIQKGDRIRYNGHAGEVEFVVEEVTGDAALDWYVEEYGGGVMLSVSTYGNLFLETTEDDEDLTFVSRR